MNETQEMRQELTTSAGIEGRLFYEYNFPIWKCECGYLNRFFNTFGEICWKCQADHTLDWISLIVNDEIRRDWEKE